MSKPKMVLASGVAAVAASLLSSAAFAQAAQPSSATTEGPRVSTSSSAGPAAPSPPQSAEQPKSAPQDTAAAQSTAPPPSQPANGPRQVTRAGSDRLDLDTTVVTGNRELPKVLYIVPWKKADIGELPGQPFNTLLDETLAPVDRDVFRREVTYYGAVSSGGDSAVSVSPTQGGGTEK